MSQPKPATTRPKVSPAVIGVALVLGAGALIFVIDSLGEAEGDPNAVTVSIPPPADVAEPPPDATRTQSGLASRVLTPGTGARRPTRTSRVEVHYSGWTTNGRMFDSSVIRGEPIEFPLTGVIAGWTEGLQLMVEGERRRLWIPEALAYRGQPERPAGMLVFDVELIRIVD